MGYFARGLLLLCAALPSVHAVADPLQGIYGLIERRIPGHTNDFKFNLINGTGDSFVVSDTKGESGKITISCTTVSACARGLYTYVTDVGGVDIWWTGSRLSDLPSHLPSVGNKNITGSAIVPYRYHFNTVTFGYTTAFWDFSKWELLLDWLALHGVNLPLAWVGFEATLISTFREIGLTDADIASFLSGPAFLPWNRFGNIQGAWGGDLPMQWVDDQAALGKQIVARMVELGMTPILPSFTGFVPRALQTLFPNASIVNGSQWDGFPLSLTNTSFLEPFDPLFAQLQMSFITKQRAAYGDVSHFYTLDQYNENDPYSADASYLANISAGTFASLRAADPEAVWVMQGWLFFASASFWTNDLIEAFLSGAPGADDMLILDLFSEFAPQWNHTNSYFGKSWVWCQLHDYGGTIGMEGVLPTLTNAPIEALEYPGSTMKGVGLSMEGMEPGNEIVYDILLDQAWSASPLDIASYVQGWVARRYQVKTLPEAAQEAWAILSTTVYNNQNAEVAMVEKGVLDLSPALTGLVNRTGLTTIIPYDTNTTILPALTLLLQAADQNTALRAVPEFTFDIVSIARQLLSNRFIDLYTTLVDTFNSSKSTASQVYAAGQLLLDLLHDLDALLATNEQYLLSTWIADARSWAHGNASYAAYLEYNARNQVTLWGPDGEISDYASKQWAGLVDGYYAVRWEAFVEYLAQVKRTGGVYNQTEVDEEMLEIGKTWDGETFGQRAGEVFGTKGDTYSVVESVLKRWA